MATNPPLRRHAPLSHPRGPGGRRCAILNPSDSKLALSRVGCQGLAPQLRPSQAKRSVTIRPLTSDCRTLCIKEPRCMIPNTSHADVARFLPCLITCQQQQNCFFLHECLQSNARRCRGGPLAQVRSTCTPPLQLGDTHVRDHLVLCKANTPGCAIAAMVQCSCWLASGYFALTSIQRCWLLDILVYVLEILHPSQALA